MFEKYQFDGVYIAIQAVLTLYAQGTVTTKNKLITAFMAVGHAALLTTSLFCLPF